MPLRFRYHHNMDLHGIYTKTNTRFSILLSRKWQDSWRSAVRESASVLSRFPDSKDLKSKSKTSLGSDYSKSSEQSLQSPNFSSIYPSQRQNLLPTLEIITHTFQNFHNFQNFGKKFQNLEFFSEISKTTKGPPLTSKGPPPPHYPITKFSFFLRVSKARGI